jgi:hypothetical protein
MCAVAHPARVRWRTVAPLDRRRAQAKEDPMITAWMSRFSPQDESNPERGFVPKLLIGMSVLVLAGCTSTVVSLAALH